MLTETSPELIEAFKTDNLEAAVANTGGGVMVLTIALGEGREVWLTREDKWIVGFYNFVQDPEDEGICFDLLLGTASADDAHAVAAAVAGTLRRLAVV